MHPLAILVYQAEIQEIGILVVQFLPDAQNTTITIIPGQDLQEKFRGAVCYGVGEYKLRGGAIDAAYKSSAVPGGNYRFHLSRKIKATFEPFNVPGRGILLNWQKKDSITVRIYSQDAPGENAQRFGEWLVSLLSRTN